MTTVRSLRQRKRMGWSRTQWSKRYSSVARLKWMFWMLERMISTFGDCFTVEKGRRQRRKTLSVFCIEFWIFYLLLLGNTNDLFGI